MTRFLPLSIFLLTSSAAQAQVQQTDQTTTAPDSLPAARPGLILDPVIWERTSLPAFTTIQPLLSRVAGVQVTPFSGAPGAWATVRIRGATNLTGNSQPLYVVDGVPVYNTDATPEKWSGMESFFTVNSPTATWSLNTPTPHTPNANPLLDMPMEDVAQITVLRGAAATARYGMQGSNGVILITTKTANDLHFEDQPCVRVRYSGWGGVQQVRQRYDLLSARQYADLVNYVSTSAGRAAPYSAADLGNLGTIDWQDELFRPAGIQSHNLSLDGLVNKTRYYVAADYLDQAGVIVKSGLRRYSLRLNLDQQLTRKLSVGLRASASQADQHHAGAEFDAGSLVQGFLFGIPALPARDPYNLQYQPTPRRNLDENSGTARTRRRLTQLSATYQFSNDLSLSARGSREQLEGEALTYAPKDYNTTGQHLVESATSTTTTRNWVVDAALRYQHTFGARHAVGVALNYLRQQDQKELNHREYSRMRNYYFRLEEKRLAIHSPSAVVGYTFAGRYEVQASMRTEFASGKAADDKKVWLPGAELSWHLHKENFLAAAESLTDLTLWVGSGKTSSFFTPDRTTHHDAGLRAGLLHGRLTLEVAAYQRRTAHAQAVFPFTVTTNTGYGTLYASPDITLRNRGLELTASSRWQAGPLTGNTQLAAASTHTIVETIDVSRPFSGRIPGNLQEGQPMGRFYVADQNGTYPAGTPSAGQRRFRDVNHDGQITYLDNYYDGQGLPRYSLNLTQQLRFKRLQLVAQFDGLFGYQLLNSPLLMLDSPAATRNSTTRALSYWTPTNQNTLVPSAGTNRGPYDTTSRAELESGSHLRLSQLTLSFEVVNTGKRQASVWVGGQNLFVTGPYRGFDPNVSSGGAAPYYAGQDATVYPVARVWQLGVRGQF
ncbi:TonB-dependent receptor plug domain-containing protein [Hymenobacter lucidus]|uniref:TonB-dependent receptor plug domain-containing protein n=1 Tax=Hymenobacter lucidus TaxID=2880930 RepID=A0ABS8AM19_9BACT|nr:TonB-dependent receptor plug domain-containing protein [Hymenobacter lucidus]MCB2406683.1 TonB-dependent receptor plug domain-containing protein [Hymenobacter lucidus]